MKSIIIKIISCLIIVTFISNDIVYSMPLRAPVGSAIPRIDNTLKQVSYKQAHRSSIKEKAVASLIMAMILITMPVMAYGEAFSEQTQIIALADGENSNDVSQEEIDRLIEDLKNKDKDVCESAVKALGEIGPEAKKAIPALMEALENSYYRIDLLASVTETLIKIGPVSIPYLIDMIQNERNRVRESAYNALEKLNALTTEVKIMRYMADLKDSIFSSAVREAKKKAMVDEIGAGAVPFLIEYLKDEDKRNREAAAESLGLLGPEAEKAVPLLTAALKDRYGEVSTISKKALVRIGYASVPYLIDTVNDEDEEIRCLAVEALGEIGDPRALPALITATHDSKISVRYAAARALGKIDDPRATEALIDILKMDSTDTGFSMDIAEESLAGKGKSAVPALINALEADIVCWQGEERILTALGEIGDPEAVPVLIKILEDRKAQLRDRAAWALGEIGDPRAVPALIKALKDKNDRNFQHLQSYSAEALGKIGDPRALPALIKLLGEEVVSNYSAWALGEIGDPRAVPALIRILGSKDEYVHESAAMALLTIDTPESWFYGCLYYREVDAAIKDVSKEEALKYGVEALGHGNSIIRKNAMEALMKVSPEDADKFKVYQALGTLKVIMLDWWPLFVGLGGAAVGALKIKKYLEGKKRHYYSDPYDTYSTSSGDDSDPEFDEDYFAGDRVEPEESGSRTREDYKNTVRDVLSSRKLRGGVEGSVVDGVSHRHLPESQRETFNKDSDIDVYVESSQYKDVSRTEKENEAAREAADEIRKRTGRSVHIKEHSPESLSGTKHEKLKATDGRSGRNIGPGTESLMNKIPNPMMGRGL